MRIAIASGKGGTGKTFFSTNLFYVLDKKGHKVTLTDCDAEEPNSNLFFNGKPSKQINVTQINPIIDLDKCKYCGKCSEWCNYNAIFFLSEQKVISVLDDLCHGCGACFEACKFEAINEKEVSLGKINFIDISENSQIIESRTKVGVYTPVPLIKRAIKESGNRGIILFDAPPGTSCPFIHTVDSADYIILVTEPTPFGLSDLKQSIEILKDLNKHFGVVINRADDDYQDIHNYLQANKIPLLLEIPFDRDIAKQYSQGEIYAKTNTNFGNTLYKTVNKIINEYGNSSN